MADSSSSSGGAGAGAGAGVQKDGTPALVADAAGAKATASGAAEGGTKADALKVTADTIHVSCISLLVGWPDGTVRFIICFWRYT